MSEQPGTRHRIFNWTLGGAAEALVEFLRYAGDKGKAGDVLAAARSCSIPWA